jgi:hypothetical protein
MQLHKNFFFSCATVHDINVWLHTYTYTTKIVCTTERIAKMCVTCSLNGGVLYSFIYMYGWF